MQAETKSEVGKMGFLIEPVKPTKQEKADSAKNAQTDPKP